MYEKKNIIILSAVICTIGILILLFVLGNSDNQNGSKEDANCAQRSIGDYSIIYTGEDKVVQSKETKFNLCFVFDKDFYDDNDIKYIKLSVKASENDKQLFEKKLEVLCEEIEEKDGYYYQKYDGLMFDSSEFSGNGVISIRSSVYNSNYELVEVINDSSEPHLEAHYYVGDEYINYFVK